MAASQIAPEATLAEEALPIGTTLSGDQFTITDHLGAGGFGITYQAKDNVLGRVVVIKECFPTDFCTRSGLDAVARSNAFADQLRSITGMFMREARSLAKLRHPNIVGVHNAFEQNGTAYMALDLIQGRDLFDVLENDVTLPPKRVRDILLQLLNAVEKIHEMGLLHRDISPDNILIEDTGTPVLIDFGAARADARRKTRAVSTFLVVKDGYSPQELYVAGSEQGPSSDLYALAATFYHILTGAPPPNSQTRLIEIAGNKPDPCVPLAGRIEGYDDAFLEAIDTALKVHPADRLQSAAKWRSLIQAEDDDTRTTSTPSPSSQGLSIDLERSIIRLVEETNDEVRRISQNPEAPKAPPPALKKETSKPEWVDDFNRDTSVEADVPAIKPDAFAAPTEPKASARTQSETNWINRAAEKQDRIRSERENQLEIELQSLSRDGARLLSVDIPEKPTPTIKTQGPRFHMSGPFFGWLCICYFFLLGYS